MLPNARRQSALSTDTSMWEENFQDLSSFCKDPLELSNFPSNTSIGRENAIVQDDELNTPEIGNEFNFNSWIQPESFDDNYLWDDDPLEKIKSNHGNEDFIEMKNEDLTDKTNSRCIDIHMNSDESNFQGDNLYGDFGGQINSEIVTIQDVKTEEQKKDVLTVYEEVHSHVSEEQIQGNSHSVGIAVTQCSPVHSAEANSMRSKLHLPLTFESTGDVLNTPEVLARFDSQQEFDLLSFVLEDSANVSTSDETPEQPHEIYHSTFSSVKQEACEDSSREKVDNSSDTPTLCSTTELYNEEEIENVHYLVVPTSSNDCSSKIRVVIKRESTAHVPVPSSSTHKLVSVCCDTNKVQSFVVKSKEEESDFKDDDDDDDEEEEDDEPPPKIRKRVTKKKSTSECSRYRELRNRNNEASRKSRQNRKVREEEMKAQAAVLEAENQKLKIRAEELEKLVDTLRKALLNAMVRDKN